MKRLIKTLGAQLGTALLFAAAASAQDGAAPPADAPVIIAGSGAAAGAGGFVGGAGGTAGFGGMAPPTADIRVVNDGAGIPVGGGLLIYSGSGSGTPPIVEIADAATPTTTLGGTLTQVAGSYYWVWVPTSPLTVDTLYQVRLSEPSIGIIGVTDTFTAVAEITIARPEIATDPSASWRGETSGMAFCQTLIGGTLQPTSSFPNQTRASIMLEPGFSTGDPALLLNQFLFRLGNDEVPAASAFPGIWPNVAVSPIYTQAEEYCFELQAIEIVSGMVFTYDDVEHCAPHGDLPDLGVTDIEPGVAELDRLVCHAPPDQYKDTWCDLNEDPCAEDEMATGCGLYGFVCEGEPLPPDPFSMTAGFGGMGGFGAIGGAGTGVTGAVGGTVMSGGAGGQGGASGMSDEGGDASDGNSSGGDSGCSVSDARGGSGGGAVLFLLALTTLLRRPFRRTRSRAAR